MSRPTPKQERLVKKYLVGATATSRVRRWSRRQLRLVIRFDQWMALRPRSVEAQALYHRIVEELRSLALCDDA